MMAADFCRLRLPSRGEVGHKNHVMRVPHRDRNTVHLAKCQLDRKLVSHLGLTHRNLEFVT